MHRDFRRRQASQGLSLLDQPFVGALKGLEGSFCGGWDAIPFCLGYRVISEADRDGLGDIVVVKGGSCNIWIGQVTRDNELWYGDTIVIDVATQ
jgi:hypothetical protein